MWEEDYGRHQTVYYCKDGVEEWVKTQNGTFVKNVVMKWYIVIHVRFEV